MLGHSGFFVPPIFFVKVQNITHSELQNRQKIFRIKQITSAVQMKANY